MLYAAENVHREEASVCVHLPESREILTGGRDGLTRLWSQDDLSPHRDIYSPTAAGATCCTHNGLAGPDQAYFLGRVDGRVDQYSQNFTEHCGYDGRNAEFKRNERQVLAIEHFAGSRYLVSHPWQISLCDFRTHSLRLLQKSFTGLATWITHILKLRSCVFVTTHGSTLSVWNFPDNASLHNREVLLTKKAAARKDWRSSTVNPGFIAGVDMLSASELVYGKFDGLVHGFDFVSCEETFVLDAHAGKVCAVKRVSPLTLLSCGEDGVAKLWDVRSGVSVVELGVHGAKISAVDVWEDHYCASLAQDSGRHTHLHKWDLRVSSGAEPSPSV